MARQSATGRDPSTMGVMSRIAVFLVSLIAVGSCGAAPTPGLSPTLSSLIGPPKSSTQQMGQAGATSPVRASRPAATSIPAISQPADSMAANSVPADSPLATCIDPTPPAPKPVDTALAQDFAGGRIRVPLSLDDGTFRAVPAPPNARPRVSTSLALCNLLAGATANNFSVIDAATEHGMSFGLERVL